VSEWLDVDADNVESSILDVSTVEAGTVEAGTVEAGTGDAVGWGELELRQTGGVRHVRARLPVSWLATVWAPGLAVVGRYLVVHVLDAAWPTARVLALREPGSAPAELTIRDDTGHWTVAAS
jgi:hypothetical protein